jgi:hypothetical protein
MPRPHAALIVDSDPKGLESLVYGFQGAGWRITACPTPETASLLVKASAAEIVVIASRAGHDKVHTLLRQLRSRDVFRALPVLLLGPQDLRELARSHGDVDVLPFPAFVRDVLTAAQLLVGAGVAAAQKPGEEPCFADSLTAQGTLSLVRTMSGLARSGALHVVRKGRHGEILFHEGELTAAQIGSLQGMAAVQHILVWADGNFELRLRSVARRGQLHQTAQEFLEEFDRFQRDYTHAIKDIGPPSTVYNVNEERLHRSTSAVPAEVTPVVRLCDGQRLLCDVIDESPFRVLDTIRILSRLIELAILNRRDPKPEESNERTALDEFWATARITSVAREGTDQAEPITLASQAAGSPPQPAGGSATKTGNPFEAKPRPKRQTLEIGTPTSPSARSSAELPAEGMTTIKVGGPEPTRPPSEMPPLTPLQSANESPQLADSKPALPDGQTPPCPATQQGALVEDQKFSPPANLRTPPPTGRRTPVPIAVSGHPQASPATGVPIVRPNQAHNTQASGAFELPKTGRQTRSTVRAAEPRRSVVIDTQLVSVVAAGPAAPSPPPAPAQASDAGSSVRMTGELQVAPSKKTGRNAPAPARITVQLDASLTEEQRTPNPNAISASEPSKESSRARMAGEPKGVSSSKASRSTPETRPSLQVDPSLSASAERRGTPAQGTHGIHRPSGSFSAVESDFFAREADLYKEDRSESFADLDESKETLISKNKQGTSSDKRK